MTNLAGRFGIFKRLWRDDGGAVLATEWLLVTTVLVLGLVPGLIAIRQGLLGELSDVSNATSGLDQSYGFTGQEAAAATAGAAAPVERITTAASTTPSLKPLPRSRRSTSAATATTASAAPTSAVTAAATPAVVACKPSRPAAASSKAATSTATPAASASAPPPAAPLVTTASRAIRTLEFNRLSRLYSRSTSIGGCGLSSYTPTHSAARSASKNWIHDRLGTLPACKRFRTASIPASKSTKARSM